jgi:hypothetical protein
MNLKKGQYVAFLTYKLTVLLNEMIRYNDFGPSLTYPKSS